MEWVWVAAFVFWIVALIILLMFIAGGHQRKHDPPKRYVAVKGDIHPLLLIVKLQSQCVREGNRDGADYLDRVIRRLHQMYGY